MRVTLVLGSGMEKPCLRKARHVRHTIAACRKSTIPVSAMCRSDFRETCGWGTGGRDRAVCTAFDAQGRFAPRSVARQGEPRLLERGNRFELGLVGHSG